MSETHHNPRYESSTHATNKTLKKNKLMAGTSKITGNFASSDFLLSISNVLCDLQVRHFAGLVVTQNPAFSPPKKHIDSNSPHLRQPRPWLQWVFKP